MRLPDAITHARAIIQAELAPKVPGLAVAAAVDGERVWSEQVGYADLSAHLPVGPTTRFRIGSVSKPLTATGLALLVEQGKLDLDAPVQTYLPDFPRKAAVITTRQLAGHLSGIRNYRGREATCSQPFPNLRAGLKIFEDDPLEAPPGTKFSYCSYNWNVLGAVMEAAARQDFLEYMDHHVIQPLGLANTRADQSGVVDPRRACFYETGASGTFIPAPAVDQSHKWPSGGFLSTAEDLIGFGSAHLRPGFLKAESLELLFTSQSTITGTPTHYGIGWFVGRGSVHHGGDAMGGTSILLLLPASRVVVAIVTNGSQLLLRNARRQGKAAPQQVDPFLFNKESLAYRIARAFAPSPIK